MTVARNLSFMIILTTIHAQDFRDEAGDRNEGRETIPIVMPRVGRLSMPVGLAFWSLILIIGWCRNVVLGGALVGMGILVGSRFYYVRDADADKTSYLLYNVSPHHANLTSCCSAITPAALAFTGSHSSAHVLICSTPE